MAVLFLAPSSGLRAQADAIPTCLYGKITVGDDGTAVAPCGADINGIGKSPDVLAVMRTFDIAPGSVTFQACPGGSFSASPAESGTGRFLVRYPSAVESDYLAPIVHELGHVVQMKSAGGLEALDPARNSRRIELGADFLAGLAFNLTLQRLDGGDFETNLQLVGSYVDKSKRDDHGPPEYRTTAFRRGWIRKEPYSQLTIVESLNYWYANDYARLSR